MIRVLAIAGALLLAGCSGGGEPTAQATEDTVDACYQEQAEEYESAARLAESTIQTNMPTIVRATGDMLEAGISRNTQALHAAHGAFSEASDSMLAAGTDFSAKMDRADALCD